jgi:toxin CptA
VSNRIDLTLSRCVAVGWLAAAPWLVASAFALTAGAFGKTWMYTLAPLTLMGAMFQYRLNGLLAGPSAVLGLHQDQGTLYARLGNGQTVAVRACPSSRISSKLVLLKLQPAASRSGSYPIVLLSGKRIDGNLSEDQFRRLRMWLLLGRTQQSFE